MNKKPVPRNNSFTAESKTIAMLPSTTLKYREDTPEPQETAMKHSSGFWSPNSRLSPSASQETLRPSKPSQRMFLGDNEDDDDDDDDDVDMDWQPPSAFANRKDSVSITQERLQNLHTSGSSSSLGMAGASSEGMSGMRRTPSGMFMPYEEDEDDLVSEGLFGKVVDTVNTAKDIAHVIWNVGWRRWGDGSDASEATDHPHQNPDRLDTMTAAVAQNNNVEGKESEVENESEKKSMATVIRSGRDVGKGQ